MLKAMRLPLPHQILVHGWWQKEGQKLSKSTGNVVDPVAVIDEWGSDAFRFYLVRELDIGPDGNWTDAGFRSRYQSELANGLGNLVNRSLSMIGRYRERVIPSGTHQLAAETAEAWSATIGAYRANSLQEAVQRTGGLITRANQYIDQTSPFKIAKDPSCASDLNNILYTLQEFAVRWVEPSAGDSRRVGKSSNDSYLTDGRGRFYEKPLPPILCGDTALAKCLPSSRAKTALIDLSHALILVLLTVLAAVNASWVRAQPAIGTHGAVATVDRIASQAGIDAMKNGGNAVDAAIAAALTLGVVNGYNSGIGGGCFILIRRSNGVILCIDGRETAPAAATRDMYLRGGKPDLRAQARSGAPGQRHAWRAGRASNAGGGNHRKTPAQGSPARRRPSRRHMDLPTNVTRPSCVRGAMTWPDSRPRRLFSFTQTARRIAWAKSSGNSDLRRKRPSHHLSEKRSRMVLWRSFCGVGREMDERESRVDDGCRFEGLPRGSATADFNRIPRLQQLFRFRHPVREGVHPVWKSLNHARGETQANSRSSRTLSYGIRPRPLHCGVDEVRFR